MSGISNRGRKKKININYRIFYLCPKLLVRSTRPSSLLNNTFSTFQNNLKLHTHINNIPNKDRNKFNRNPMNHITCYIFLSC